MATDAYGVAGKSMRTARRRDNAVHGQAELEVLRHQEVRQIDEQAEHGVQGPEPADRLQPVAEQQLPIETVRCRGWRGWRLKGPRMRWEPLIGELLKT